MGWYHPAFLPAPPKKGLSLPFSLVKKRTLIWKKRFLRIERKFCIMNRIPNELKTPLIPIKNIFTQFTAKFLKIEEMEYLIHYVQFKMWPALFYINSHIFPIHPMDWKLRYLNAGVLGCTYIPYVHRNWKLGYLNVALSWTSQFFPVHERDEKTKFSNVGQ